MKIKFLFIILYFIFLAKTASQDIVPIDRRIEWKPGIPGGIPGDRGKEDAGHRLRPPGQCIEWSRDRSGDRGARRVRLPGGWQGGRGCAAAGHPLPHARRGSSQSRPGRGRSRVDRATAPGADPAGNHQADP